MLAVRFTPRAGLEGPLYAMIKIRGASGDGFVAFSARVIPWQAAKELDSPP